MYCWCGVAGNVLNQTYPLEYQICSSQPRQKSCGASSLRIQPGGSKHRVHSLLASLVAVKGPQCSAGPPQQGMTMPIHWNIKSAPSSPGRSRAGPSLYVFSLLGPNSAQSSAQGRLYRNLQQLVQGRYTDSSQQPCQGQDVQTVQKVQTAPVSWLGIYANPAVPVKTGWQYTPC